MCEAEYLVILHFITMLHRNQILPFLQDLAGTLGLDFKFLPSKELWYRFLSSLFLPYEDSNISDYSEASEPLIIT